MTFPSASTARVEISLGEHPLGLAQLGVARPDLQELSDRHDAIVAGFSLPTDLIAWPGEDGEVAISVVATSVTGEQLALPSRTIVLAPSPSPPAPRQRTVGGGGSRRGRRVLVCTHQLCLGGASRCLLELLRELLRQEAVDPVVLSSFGGPLQPELDALGIPVHVSGPAPLDDLEAHRGRVEEILAWAAPQGFEVALVNTASPLNLAGAEVAGSLGIPAVWAIHEGIGPSLLWAGCDPAIRVRMAEAVGRAALAIFVSGASRGLYEPLGLERCLTLPYGLDLQPVDALREGFDRAATRRRLGIPPEADLVLCVGVIDPRKAQASLAQAFDLIAAHHPRARLALVGAEDDLNSRALAAWAASSGVAERVELVPTTPEVQQWYGVADLLICPSRVESLPRAVVEGMSWELPVLATEIAGIPDLIDHGSTGWLCEPGDTRALAVALDRALKTGPEERRRIGREARGVIERQHSIDDYGGEIARLLEEVAVSAAVSDRR